MPVMWGAGNRGSGHCTLEGDRSSNQAHLFPVKPRLLKPQLDGYPPLTNMSTRIPLKGLPLLAGRAQSTVQAGSSS